MPSNENELPTILQTSDIITRSSKYTILLFNKSCIILQFIDHHVESINDGISSNKNLTKYFLCSQIALRKRGWREVIGSNSTSDLTVYLLWPWTVDIMSAKTSFHMSHRNLLIESSKSRCCRGSSVTMY